MAWILSLSALPALLAGAWVFHRPCANRAERRGSLFRILLLFLAGLFVAGPFLTPRALGTNEAYNYSLSVADAVTQFRHGQFPVLVGQSEYAFNGRIHPLRTAPYLAYFAGFLDCLSGRQLSFWALQNLTIALSLIGAAFSAYACLRRATRVPPWPAFALAVAYLLSPGVLAPVYSMDLYMTVMTLPFLPVVFGQCLRALKGERTFWVYALLAAALAAVWLAHPPVALWTSFGVGVLHLPLFLGFRFRLSEFVGFLAASGFGAALVAFGFASVFTLTPYESIAGGRVPEAVVKEVRQAFAASLQPISSTADQLGDFQLGYAYWLVLIASTIFALRHRQGRTAVFLGLALGYLAVTTPVPGLNGWLWSHLPAAVFTLTSQWPMQRLYLLIALVTLFAVAQCLAFASTEEPRKSQHSVLLLAFALPALWSATQAWHFIDRGYHFRRDENTTRKSHLPENINPTLISYAILGAPPSFVNGVMDPSMEFRLLRRGDASELANNWTADEALVPESGTNGAFVTEFAQNHSATLKPSLQLQPKKRYRLDFDYRGGFEPATLFIRGPSNDRGYALPTAGNARGFGVSPGNSPSLTLFTSGDEPETIELQWLSSEIAPGAEKTFADFRLRELDPAKLPVAVESWVPLKARVHAAAPAYLETPRVFIEGYIAWVNGQRVRTQVSPDRMLMLAVPVGESRVEVQYRGPYALRVAFWISFFAWLSFFTVGSFRVWRPSSFDRGLLVPLRKGALICQRHPLALTGLVLLLAGGGYGWHRWSDYVKAVGPIHVRVELPRGQISRAQPILTTGRREAGTFIYVVYLDPTHIRVGMDVWNAAFFVSAPIEVDYFAEQNFVITSGALYPPNHPALRKLSPAQLERLRHRVKVELNGNVVVDQPVSSYDSKLSEITVGESRIGGSNTEPVFVGKILKIKRLPVPSDP